MHFARAHCLKHLVISPHGLHYRCEKSGVSRGVHHWQFSCQSRGSVALVTALWHTYYIAMSTVTHRRRACVQVSQSIHTIQLYEGTRTWTCERTHIPWMACELTRVTTGHRAPTQPAAATVRKCYSEVIRGCEHDWGILRMFLTHCRQPFHNRTTASQQR